MVSEILIPPVHIASSIIVMQEVKVMLDFHLAELYSIEIRVLKQSIKRNIK